MPFFGQASMRRFNTLHPLLQSVLVVAIEFIDFTIVCGHRAKAEQDEAFNNGKSTVQFPNSKHNSFPSLAADVAPYFKNYPHIRWDRMPEFYNLTGVIMGIAFTKGINIRCGSNWDQDDEMITDQKFQDPGHIELVL